jgi:hypothetical protein
MPLRMPGMMSADAKTKSGRKVVRHGSHISYGRGRTERFLCIWREMPPGVITVMIGTVGD